MRATRRVLAAGSRALRLGESKLSWDELVALDSGPGGVNAFVTPIQKPSSNAKFKVAIKDNICTKDLPTTCSSSMLKGYNHSFAHLSPMKGFNPSYDATVVALLKKGGVSIIGKTNCDEFGMGSANIYSHHGPVINPYSLDGDTLATSEIEKWRKRERRTAGGSSGGSAAAVAMGLCDFALGTDTGGSVRLPAAYCGVVGFKPSYGLISRWGVVSFADSLDCVGILARNAHTASQAFDLTSKHDPNDPTCVPEELRSQAESNESYTRQEGSASLRGLQIGIPQEYFPSEVDPSLTKHFGLILQALGQAGANIVPVSLPSTRYALSTYYVISSAEASSNLARYDGLRYGEHVKPPSRFSGTVGDVYAMSRSRHLGEEVRRRILLGTYALTAAAFDNYFLQAQRLRLLIRDDFDRVFRQSNILRQSQENESPSSQQLKRSTRVDILLHPSAIQTAPLIDQPEDVDSLNSYVQDVLTVPASLAGLPAISLPSGVGNDGWPLGVSLVGQWGADRSVLSASREIEKVLASNSLL